MTYCYGLIEDEFRGIPGKAIATGFLMAVGAGLLYPIFAIRMEEKR